MNRFAFQMAWRDSRASRRRLLLFASCIAIGVTALVALDAFRASVSRAIDQQARTLLGADLELEMPRPFTTAEEELIRTLGPGQSRQLRFTSMLVFPRNAGTRLVQVRAQSGGFPFYGTIETEPAGAMNRLGEGGKIVVDQSLLFQFGARVGDEVRLGDATFEVVGALVRLPGDASAGAGFAPRVFLDAKDVPATNLIQPGSLVRYLAFVGFAPDVDGEARAAELEPQLQHMGFEVDTVAERKRVIGRSLDNLYRFLQLVGFIALLLGAIGVASGIYAHLQQKVRTNAILRCLGASRRRTFIIYLLQAAAVGLAGVLLGGLAGLGLQKVVPIFLRSLLPFELPEVIVWYSVFRGCAIGFVTCMLFALPPLLRFRKVPPLLVLRQATDESAGKRDWLVWVSYGLIGAAVTLFAISQAKTATEGVIFAGALLVVLLIFAGAARLLMALVRRFFPQGAAFVLRQGLANLYRPNNRTLLLTVALGLATFLLLDLQLTRDVLLAQFRSLGAGDQPNIFLFDIQPDQRQAVNERVRALGFPIIQEAPIVTMRISEIKGRRTADILTDPDRKIPEWQLEREYRSTFRDHMTNTEKIVAGEWIGQVNYQAGETVPISLDEELAGDWNATVGDEVVFDVQGIPLRTRVASLREIDWRRFQTNFFVVFPKGVLENAPGFHVLVSRAETPAESARLQNAIVSEFPNVSAIDLAAVIQTVDAILAKVALAIRIVSFFAVAAGLLVVGSAIWSGRYQRVEESVLLRTLGAKRSQIWAILAAEYAFLGLLASSVGVGLSVIASWALARFVFELAFVPSLPLLVGAAVIATAVTVLVGLLASRGVGNAPPLQILRAEGG